jgi:hypothetical protein
MAFQPVVSTVEMVVRWNVHGHIVVNTFYAYYGGAYDQDDVNDLAETMDGWVDDGLKTLLSQEASYAGVAVRGLANENDYYAENNDGAGICGVAQNSWPNNVAFCVKRSSAYTGRSARGRVYIPAVPYVYAAADENYIVAADADALVEPLDNLRGVILAAGGWTEVVVSRFNQGEKRETAATFPVTGYSYTTLRIASMRGRLPALT